MKDESPPQDNKSPHERFIERGTKVLSVTKKEIEKREKEWRRSRRRHGRPTK